MSKHERPQASPADIGGLGLPPEIASLLERGDFPKLDDDEFAKLGAWLNTCSRAFSVLKSLDGSRRLDDAAVADSQRRRDVVNRLRAIHEYNAAPRQPAARAKTGDVGVNNASGKDESKEQQWQEDATSPGATVGQARGRTPRTPTDLELKIAVFYAESGETMTGVADTLNTRIRDELAKAKPNPLFPLTQQKVSRIITVVNRYRKANQQPLIRTRRKRPESPAAFAPSIDPAVIDMGPRQDHKTKSSRQQRKPD